MKDMSANYIAIFFLLIGIYIVFVLICQFIDICSLNIKTIVKFSFVLLAFVIINHERSVNYFIFHNFY